MTRDPLERSLRIGDVDLTLFDWPGREPAALLVHATGFHARCWDGVAAALDDVRLVAVDLRGHGTSSKRPPYGWSTFGQDMVALCERLEIERWVGVGHSLGGHVVTQVAAIRPASFRALVLVDPVILPPEAYASLPAGFDEGTSHYTAKRRNRFDSPDAMYARFKDRAPYSLWRPDVLRAYCMHGLVPDPDGGYRLACPPEVEASIYQSSRGFAIYDLIPKVRVPVVVLRARSRDTAGPTVDFSSSPTWPQLAAQFPTGRDVHVPELTHFIPMQEPELVADYVREARG